MRLSIKNLGKIKKAEIDLNGITVIAGDNDTGKSTVGKALYAMFNSFHGLADNIQVQRLNSITNTVMSGVVGYDDFPYKRVPYIRNIDDLFELMPDMIKEQSISSDFILEKAKSIIGEKYGFDMSSNEGKYLDLKQRLDKILQITDEEIVRQIVGDEFNVVFHGQVNSLNDNSVTVVEMIIKKQPVKAVIIDNTCTEAEITFNLAHSAVYIDDPLIIDRLSEGRFFIDNKVTRDLMTRLRRSNSNDLLTNIVNGKILKEVMRIINRTVPGDFIRKDRQVVLKHSDFREPLNVSNLSTGVKAFAVPKLLMQNNQISEKDVLVLDEPEIHLHPEWQVLYAEFLVLFQKAFDLTILLTTHSPYFLNAIEVFSRKYERLSNVNYYQTKVEDGNMVTLVEVTDKLDEIYGSMAAPFNKLSEMEQELEMES